MSQPWWNSEDPAEQQADAAFDRALRLVAWAVVLVPLVIYLVVLK